MENYKDLQMPPSTHLVEAMRIIDRGAAQIGLVVDEQEHLLGTLTDGDIRRLLTKIQKPFSALLGDDVVRYSVQNPTTVSAETQLHDAVALMGEKQVWDLPVVSGNKLIGVLHLHPALKAVMNAK